MSSDVRDRLKVRADRADRTLGEHLAHLADLGDREFRFKALRRAIDNTPAEALDYYAKEVTDWERVYRGCPDPR